MAFNMVYDAKGNTKSREYTLLDYCRCRALELIAEEIYKNDIQGSVAEAGVACGDFARLINSVFPDRKLYLYDTFEGFSDTEKQKEIDNGYTSAEFFELYNDLRGKGVEKNIEIVRSKMRHKDNCIFRQGLFPESAQGEINETFAFVSIDMDLYEPILAALHFFYPRLSKGGYIFLHDYNHIEFLGIKKAVEEFEKSAWGEVSKFPLPDEGGTLVIVKPQ